MGSVLTSNNGFKTEVDCRIIKYTRNLSTLYPLLRDNRILRKVRTHIYTTILRLVLLYSSETWVISRKLKNRIQEAEMSAASHNWGTRRDRLRNEVEWSERFQWSRF